MASLWCYSADISYDVVICGINARKTNKSLKYVVYKMHLHFHNEFSKAMIAWT